jgi:uncharacterized membrane protein
MFLILFSLRPELVFKFYIKQFLIIIVKLNVNTLIQILYSLWKKAKKLKNPERKKSSFYWENKRHVNYWFDDLKEKIIFWEL